MAKIRSKQFTLRNPYHFAEVDRWWAGLLQSGMKAMVSVEWTARGEMDWQLKVNWQPIEGAGTMNVGHPRYSDLETEHITDIFEDILAEYEATCLDAEHLAKKVEDWELKEVTLDGPQKFKMLSFRDDLDEAERLIAIDYLWPQHKQLQKLLPFMRVKMQELAQELKARKADDYYVIVVDRGMLREAFVAQVGYDNEWLFEDSNGSLPHLEE